MSAGIRGRRMDRIFQPCASFSQPYPGAYALSYRLGYRYGVYVWPPASLDGASAFMKHLLGVNVVYHQFHDGSLTNGLLETLFVTYLYIGEQIANLLYTKKLPSQRPLWQLLRLVSIDNRHSVKHVQFSQTIQVSTHVHAASSQDG